MKRVMLNCIGSKRFEEKKSLKRRFSASGVLKTIYSLQSKTIKT